MHSRPHRERQTPFGASAIRVRTGHATCARSFVLALVFVAVQACGLVEGPTITDPANPAQPTPPSTPAPPPSFTITVNQPEVPVLQGGTGESQLTIVRSAGFTAPITITVAGAPTGLATTIGQSTTGTSVTIAIVAAPTLAEGTDTLTVTARAAGLTERTALIAVIVGRNTGGAGNVRVDFSGCSAENRPVWFAIQDGVGAWTQILGTGDVYQFNVLSQKGGFAFRPSAEITTMQISLATRAELTAGTLVPCAASGGKKTVSGTLYGLAGREVAYVEMGGTFTDSHGPVVTTTFNVHGVGDGPRDLIAFRSIPNQMSDRERVLIRRDQNIAAGALLGIIDMDADETFAPVSARVTVLGAQDEQVDHFMDFTSGTECSIFRLYDHWASGPTFMMRGIPSARQRAGELHRISVGHYRESSYRFATEYFRDVADRTIQYPGQFAAASVERLPGGHGRMQARAVLSAEYRTSTRLHVFSYQGSVVITASYGWIGGPEALLTVPDFSRVAGWRSVFLPPHGVTLYWYLIADGGDARTPGRDCVENARYVTASEWGIL